jgi:ABC-type branched-subunit amino acid transport system ATPase component
LVAGNGRKQLLNSVNLEAARSEFVALIGRNEAKKSTLLKVAFGMIPISRGRFIGMAQDSRNPLRAKCFVPASLMCCKATGCSPI